MAEITSGLRSILSHPQVYEFLQQITGAQSARRKIVDRFIRPQPGDRILDIGCGPAELLAFMPEVDYVGYDPNPRYIDHARKHFAGRGSFITGSFGPEALNEQAAFDITILVGVLHHLDDAQAASVLALSRAALKPGGRLITLDCVLIDNQNPIARTLIKWDRGKNVRRRDEYRALAASHYSEIKETILHTTWPPYTRFVMECT